MELCGTSLEIFRVLPVCFSVIMPLYGVGQKSARYCPVCKLEPSFLGRWSLPIHLQTQHKLDLIPSCNVCQGESFYSAQRWSDVKKHVSKMHEVDVAEQLDSTVWLLVPTAGSRSYSGLGRQHAVVCPVEGETVDLKQVLTWANAGVVPWLRDVAGPSTRSGGPKTGAGGGGIPSGGAARGGTVTVVAEGSPPIQLHHPEIHAEAGCSRPDTSRHSDPLPRTRTTRSRRMGILPAVEQALRARSRYSDPERRTVAAQASIEEDLVVIGSEPVEKVSPRRRKSTTPVKRPIRGTAEIRDPATGTVTIVSETLIDEDEPIVPEESESSLELSKFQALSSTETSPSESPSARKVDWMEAELSPRKVAACEASAKQLNCSPTIVKTWRKVTERLKEHAPEELAKHKLKEKFPTKNIGVQSSVNMEHVAVNTDVPRPLVVTTRRSGDLVIEVPNLYQAVEFKRD